MPYCRNCGNEMDNSVKCDECGFSEITNNKNIISTDDTGGFGYFILGACIPIVGLILFITWNTTKPRSAKAAGLGALLLFPMIIIMGIVAAFVIPAMGQIIENTQKSAIFADALVIEQAANLHCSDTTCTADQELTWDELNRYIGIEFDETYYDLTNNGGIIATKSASGWMIDLEAVDTGNWEFTQGSIPSAVDRNSVVVDLD